MTLHVFCMISFLAVVNMCRNLNRMPGFATVCVNALAQLPV